jgi:hypothetical protein
LSLSCVSKATERVDALLAKRLGDGGWGVAIPTFSGYKKEQDRSPALSWLELICENNL